ncbi:hypothetical protein BDF20DRAFT_829867 [Mycotypha africana]|uniref:uncharacterized protein n=1 Tax=Mycotypha africana TaxID=64632 RepID=UPI002301ECAB|nr:uncharacterized protein BDF20DRAFT_829867 [Mycotypha africana]KAI8967238.1 hypothetical protein BDF20DRAFT_829867 [Mycotypha africana]
MRNGEYRSHSGNFELRVLCRQRQGYQLEQLEKMGAKIWEVNYTDEHKMREVMRNVCHVLMVPESSRDTLKEAETLMCAAKHESVDHFSMVSVLAVDRVQSGDINDQHSNEFRTILHFHKIEEKLKKEFHGEKHCIMRIPMLNQFFYFLAPKIEGENIVPLPVKKDKKWSSIDLNDIVEAIYCLAKKRSERSQQQQSGDAFHHKQVYNFTCSKVHNTEEIVKQMGEGLDQRDLHFKEISENDLKQWLHKLKDDKKFSQRPDDRNDFRKGRDGFASFPLGKFLHEDMIEILMEYWRLVNKGKLDMQTDDLEKVLERKPHTIKEYFEVNRQQFKRLK